MTKQDLVRIRVGISEQNNKKLTKFKPQSASVTNFLGMIITDFVNNPRDLIYPPTKDCIRNYKMVFITKETRDELNRYVEKTHTQQKILVQLIIDNFCYEPYPLKIKITPLTDK